MPNAGQPPAFRPVSKQLEYVLNKYDASWLLQVRSILDGLDDECTDS
jgi:hypothetical protein